MENLNKELMNNVEVLEPTAENFVVVETINNETTKELVKSATKGFIIAGALIGTAVILNQVVMPKLIEKAVKLKMDYKRQKESEEVVDQTDDFDTEF